MSNVVPLRPSRYEEEDALTSGGGRLAGVDVADNDDVDMELLLTEPDVSS